MSKLRTLSLAASLMAATVLTAPAFAIDLGGGLGGNIGGAIGPSGIGGSVGGTINGTLDTTMRTGDRIGGINNRADRVIDRTQTRVDRTVNSIEVPDAPSAEQLTTALKQAGYGDATLDTPAGSASGSASGEASADASQPDLAVPVLPGPVAAANDAVDEVQATKTDAAKRAAAALPAKPMKASVSGSADAKANADGTTETSEPAVTPASDDANSPDAAVSPSDRPEMETGAASPQN